MKNKLWLFFSFWLSSYYSFSQTTFTFQNHYGGNNEDIFTDAHQTLDKGYIACGYTNSFGNGGYDILLVKTNSIGDTIWTKTFGGSKDDWGYSVAQTTDSGFIVAGNTESFYVGIRDAYLIKTNKNGDTLWTKTFGGSQNDNAFSVKQTKDGGFIIAGETQSYNGPTGNIFLIRTNAVGGTLWTKAIGGNITTYGYSVIEDYNGDFLITGFGPPATVGTWDVCVLKTNANGDSLWYKKYGGSWEDRGNCIIQTADSGYAIAGFKSRYNGSFTDQEVYLIRLNRFGDSLWTKVYGDTSYFDYAKSVKQTSDGGFIIAGTSYGFGVGGYKTYLLKTDANGDTLWTKLFPGSDGYSVDLTSDGGFIVGGYCGSCSSIDGILIKTKSISNQISGTVYGDVNTNCILDTNDLGLKGILVKAEPGPYYAVTNSSGHYAIYLDTGNYVVTQVGKNELWNQQCSPLSYNVSFNTSTNSSSGNNFGSRALFQCPRLWLDISSSVVRGCSASTYSLQICNEGSAPDSNILVQVEFDNNITPFNSSIPWFSVKGNSYYFNLGKLYPADCKSFNISANISCSAPIGSTVCVSAKVPDFSCWSGDTAYEDRQIILTGNCINNDSIRFVIRNELPPPATRKGIYKIWENNVAVKLDTFLVAGGDSMVVFYPSNGKTIRFQLFYCNFITVAQNKGIEVTIESCGSNTSYGNVGQLPFDQNHDNYDEVCSMIRTSYDPNEKSVIPIGLTNSHFISPDVELDYTIQFQNTGNDTAFYVMIRDTISPYFDISSIKSGASSHPYVFNVYGNGIAEWVFPNILLPDSNTNELQSHGFVNFTIQQNKNNSYNTLIKNKALIYFDFNNPVITNETENRVCATPVSSFIPTVLGSAISLNNTSSNSNLYIWNYGDGIIDTSTNPIHSYSLNGQYHVCLFAANDCENSLSCQTIQVTTVGISNNSFHHINFYPNPLTSSSTLQLNTQLKDAEVIISDILGKKMVRKNLTGDRMEIERGSLVSGVYFVRVVSEKGQWVEKVVVE